MNTPGDIPLDYNEDNADLSDDITSPHKHISRKRIINEPDQDRKNFDATLLKQLKDTLDLSAYKNRTNILKQNTKMETTIIPRNKSFGQMSSTTSLAPQALQPVSTDKQKNVSKYEIIPDKRLMILFTLRSSIS